MQKKKETEKRKKKETFKWLSKEEAVAQVWAEEWQNIKIYFPFTPICFSIRR